MKTCHAVLFDLDGVVIDSSGAHAAAWEALFAAHGVAFGPDRYAAEAAGRPREAVIRGVLGDLSPAAHARAMARKVELVEDWLATHRLPVVPGTLPFVDALDAAGVPYAIATSSRTPELLLAGAGLAGRFPVIVHRGLVERGKPAPDLFLEAARRLSCPPGEAVVFEDAVVGVEAARAAGCPVIGLAPDEVPAGLARADRVVARLDPGWVGDWIRPVSR
jgi:HAD superfamily hydrolase (TIGR01509 family)